MHDCDTQQQQQQQLFRPSSLNVNSLIEDDSLNLSCEATLAGRRRCLFQCPSYAGLALQYAANMKQYKEVVLVAVKEFGRNPLQHVNPFC